MSTAERFHALSIFQHLSAKRLAQLGRVWSEERYEKGAVLFRQGSRADFFWVILEGWVHLIRSSTGSDGARAVVLFTITPREALCGHSALDSGIYNMSGVAATDCHALRIPAEAFNEVLIHEPHFAYDALRLTARRLQKIAEQYGAMAEPASHRVIRALLRLQEQFGATVPVTHRELGQMSWTTTETTIRTMRALKRRGYVRGTRGVLMIRRPKALVGLLKASDS